VTRLRFTLASDSPRDTESLGERLGAALRAGDVLLLSGDLGAGKTTLTRGIARGLGVEAPVKSPTFALHLRYPGRVRLDHLDLYRVTEVADLDELGLDDTIGRDGVAVVEWGERAGAVWDEFAVHVTLADRGETARDLAVAGPAETVARLARAAGVEPEEVR
jgi:tRNA threonylcarbamoyladenosine biosynthesis protein TsaE